jgi:D-alanyl-D-alanine carboxypeptidase (penicillin-binding protein 5/6)
MNSKKRKKVKIHYFRILMALLLLVIIIAGIILIIKSCSGNKNSATNSVIVQSQTSEVTDASSDNPENDAVVPTTEPVSVYPKKTADSVTFPTDFDAKYGILIDADTNEIVAYRNYNTIMSPASLTKIMTLIVAVENISDLSDTVEITEDMVEPMIELEASRAGFAVGETPTLEQVLYGIILPSGADACLAAAQYVAGSEEAFVEMMNAKAKELGLKNTKFTNCVGLYDPQHHSTAEDIALILKYALENETCKKVLSTYQYEIPPTEYNPEGLTLTSTVFSRMEGTEMPGVTILGGKTGYTDEAGQCLATFAEANGKTYIMVFSGGTSKWNVVYNTLSGYSMFCVGGEAYVPPTNTITDSSY